MSKEKGLSLRDSKILTMATRGATAEQIGSELGIPAVRVVGEIDRLTKSLDWLSEMQEMALTMRALKALAGNLQELAESGHDDKQTRNYLDSLRLIFERLDKLQERAGSDIERVQNAQARVFVDMIERSFFHAMGALSQRFPDADRKALEEQFRESLMIVSAEYEQEDGVPR